MAHIHDRYQKLEKIGEGACGVVFKCRDRENDRIVAMKKVRFSYEGDGGDASTRGIVFGVPTSALREVAMLKTLCGHPNIVKIHDAFLDRGARIFIICEYIDCDLRRHMDEDGQLHPRRTKLYIWQLLGALAYCHRLCIAHRDVKPQNILVNRNADLVKLCDFSLARRVLVPSVSQTRRVSSLWYRSPEILLGGDASGISLDAWSIGCVFSEMMMHSTVFPGGSEIETLFLHFKLLGTPSETSWPGVSSLPHWSTRFPRFDTPMGGLACAARADREAGDLLAGMLQCNPSTRRSADAALAHSYFLDLDTTAHSMQLDSSARHAGKSDTGPLAIVGKSSVGCNDDTSSRTPDLAPPRKYARADVKGGGHARRPLLVEP